MMNYTSSKEERILAIDYGLKRVGLAMTDPLQILAYPFKTIPNDAGFWSNLKSIVAENNVKSIVLGYPLNSDGSRSEMTAVVEEFRLALEKNLNLTVILHDERYTSEMAKENVIKSVTSRKKRRDKGLIDQNAAAIMLREYLDESK